MRRSPKLNVNYENKLPLSRPSWDEYFINIARVVSTRSHDAETKVGAVLVDENHRILATGYNGFPPGLTDDSLPNLRPDKYPFMIHAEINAIATSRQDLRNASLYCTHSPCRDCSKAIITAGIRRVCFVHSYANDDSEFVEKFLKSCGIEVCSLDTE